MKYLLIIILLFFSSTLVSRSQEGGIALDAGYSFKFINKPLNQFYIGAIGSYSKGNRGYSSYSDEFIFGAGAYYGSYGGKQSWIPTINVGYGGLGLLYRAWITPYAVTPSINFNFFNMAQLGAGYSIGYRKKNNINFNGIVLSLNININLTGHYINFGT